MGRSEGCILLTLSACFGVADRAFAQGPASVLVVVNDNSAQSREIGDYYVRRREIPPDHVCHLHASLAQDVNRTTYDRQIAEPVARCLKNKRLVNNILYIVTTTDVPLRIEGSSGPSGTQASVDSELAALYFDLAHNQPHLIEASLPNPYFGRVNATFRHPDFQMYMVMRLTAYDVETVKRTIDDSLRAENRGKFVIDLNDESNGPGNSWLRQAAKALPQSRLVLDTSPKVIYNQTDVIGYASWGSNDKNRRNRFLGFRWLPGAIMTEFVSTNARTFKRPPADWTLGDWASKESWFFNSPQSMTGDYLQEGATGASGHVYEPYLATTPRPDILLPAYSSGRNLAESYYLSIPRLSWQNIVVGDPLCAIGKP